MYDANILNVLFGDGNHVEIDTVPGEFTNFLDCTSLGCGDRTEAWGSTTPQLLYDSLTTAQFPSEVLNLADYLPPDAWFPDINSMFPRLDVAGQRRGRVPRTRLSLRRSPLGRNHEDRGDRRRGRPRLKGGREVERPRP